MGCASDKSPNKVRLWLHDFNPEGELKPWGDFEALGPYCCWNPFIFFFCCENIKNTLYAARCLSVTVMNDSVKSSLHQQNIQKTHKQFQECAGRVKHKTRAVIILLLLCIVQRERTKRSKGSLCHSATQVRVTRPSSWESLDDQRTRAHGENLLRQLKPKVQKKPNKTVL